MIIDERQSLGELGGWISNVLASNQGFYTPTPGKTSCERNRAQGRKVVCRDPVRDAAKRLEHEKQMKRVAAMIAQAQDEENSRGGCGSSRSSSNGKWYAGMPGDYMVQTQHR